METVGIVGGAGRMGSWLAYQLRNQYDIVIFDLNKKKLKLISEKQNIKSCRSLEELIVKSNIIVIAVPLDKTAYIVDSLAEKGDLRHKIIFDIASFKKDVIKAYSKYNEKAIICSIHPLFGAGASSLSGQKIALIPIPKHEQDVAIVEDFFGKYESRTFIMDAITHDEIMGLVLGIPYLIGMTLMMTAKEYDTDVLKQLAGTSFSYLYTYSKAIFIEEPELIYSIIHQDSSKQSAKLFIKIAGFIQKMGKTKFIKTTDSVHQELGESVEEAYGRFYKFN
jgi:prephenate dehydrogenase